MIPYISTSPDQLGVLSISLRKMSARPGQTYACVIGTAGSSSSREAEESVPGVGQMASHRPATGLRTLQPTLGFLSDTRAAHEPSSPLPMATHPALGALPAQKLAETPAVRSPLPPAGCHSSLSIAALPWGCAPRLQASNLLSGRLTEDGQGQGRPPYLAPASSLPRAWMLEQELGTQMVIAAI